MIMIVSPSLATAMILPIVALASTQSYYGTYTFDSAWPKDLPKIGAMNGTSGVAVDAVGAKVYMCQQRGSPRVTVWDTNTGALLSSWGDKDLDTPHGIRIKRAMGSSKLEVWATDMGVGVVPGHPLGHVMKGFDANGNLLHTVGTPGVGGSGLNPVQFDHVADVDWTPDQTSMVAVDGDGGVNNRAVELDATSFALKASWGGIGGPTTQGKFNISHGVAIDKCSRVWVADRANHRVQIFHLNGTWINTWTCFDVPPYGVRHFDKELTAGTGRVLVAGGGGPPAWPSGVNKLSIVNYKTDCSNPADLGMCNVAYSIPVDPDSTAHFAAIDQSTEDIYLAEVSVNKFKKYTFKPN